VSLPPLLATSIHKSLTHSSSLATAPPRPAATSTPRTRAPTASKRAASPHRRGHFRTRMDSFRPRRLQYTGNASSLGNLITPFASRDIKQEFIGLASRRVLS
jgi:hypothetical protein